MKAYLKKNAFFVSLLLILFIIILGLGIHKLVDMKEEPPKETPVEVDPTPPVNDKKPAEITSFEGSYSSKDNQVSLSWSYNENSSTVMSATLYHEDTYIANVTNYRHYDMLQNSFGFPTGKNKFTLKLQLADGKTIEKSKTVDISYIISSKQDVIVKDNLASVTLTYVYEKEHPVTLQKVLTGDVPYAAPKYVDTTYETNGSLVTAKTTFQFHWDSSLVAHEPFVMRWVFSSTLVYDFPTQF